MSLDQSLHNLFVEGGDDGAVVNALVRRRLGLDLSKKPHRIVVAPDGEGGVGPALRRFFEVVRQSKPGGRIGLLVDRDGHDGKPDNWLAAREGLRKLGVVVPDEPAVLGWIGPGLADDSMVGVWLMPDNLRPGDLEHFMEDLLPENRRLWAFAATSTKAARGHGADYVDKDRRKAGLHAWLAWLDAPGGGYGTAINSKSLNASSPAADALVSWLGTLFPLSNP